jgi:hypothetical protein
MQLNKWTENKGQEVLERINRRFLRYDTVPIQNDASNKSSFS